MRIMKCNQPVYFDVDDTLLLWHIAPAGDPRAIEIKVPIGRQKRAAEDAGWLPEEIEPTSRGEWSEFLIPHKVHVQAVKNHHLRGQTVIVWSAGGWEWALAAVRALGLEDYVDLVLEKPRWAYDDLPPNEYMPKSQWYKDE